MVKAIVSAIKIVIGIGFIVFVLISSSAYNRIMLKKHAENLRNNPLNLFNDDENTGEVNEASEEILD